MPNRIITLGFKLAGDVAEHAGFYSDVSLLDADIIVVMPTILSHFDSHQTFRGKKLLDESDSHRLNEKLNRWRDELEIVSKEGRTIIAILSKAHEAYVHVDYRSISTFETETGQVELSSCYDLFPVDIGRPVSSSGTELRPANDLGVIASYWHEFAQFSKYEVYLDGSYSEVLLTTKSGGKPVAGILEANQGHFVLLPMLRDVAGIRKGRQAERRDKWDDEDVQYGKRLINAFVEIDRAVRSSVEETPSPEWSKEDQYRLDLEKSLEEDIVDLGAKIEELDAARAEKQTALRKEGLLRNLLFEKGVPLELAITEALKLMGFHVEGFQDAESEFDAVFVSSEGRFLGEAEGKDTRAINISKLSQLERNIQEDFAREEVQEYAHGVLLGNAYRLMNPSERESFFTAKCLSGADRSGISLVRTTDLFYVAKYLRENIDEGFAALTRQAILSGKGTVVTFPAIPSVSNTKREE